MDRRKCLGSIEREQTRGRNSDRLRNSEKETWERVEEFRIGERVEFPVGNKYKRNEPRRKGKRRSKGGAEGDNKSMR
jgi:hypothetical protein